MTVFETHFAAARTEIIWLCFGEGSREMCFSFSHDRHHIGGRATRAHQHGQDLVRLVDAVEESFVSSTKIIETRLSGGGFDKPVFGTFTMAGEAYITIQAVLRQGITLIQPKPGLLIRANHLEHMLVFDVAEQVVRLDEMVAGVQVTIVLEC